MSLEDSIFESVPQWDQARVRGARVLVVGAGALGNEVLKNLALLNVQRIAIMDFDRVEASNLTRSVLLRQGDADQGRYKAHAVAERLLEINPDLQLLTLLGDVVTDLSLGLLQQVDVVIGCVDNRLARLYLNRLCWRAGKPWVDGGILNLAGQVAVYAPGRACYECGLTPAAWQEIRQRLGCTDMARRYAMQGHAPTTPIAASIMGAVQVQEALKLVLGLENQALVGQMWSYEGAHMYAAVYAHKGLRRDCESHFEAVVPEHLALGHTRSLGELWAAAQACGAPQELILDHSLIVALADLQTGAQQPVILPLPHFSDRLMAELAGEGRALGVPRDGLRESLRPGDLPDATPLWALGVPPGHVLRLGRGAARRHMLLAGDLQAMEFELGVKALANPWWDMTAARLREVGLAGPANA